MQKEEHSLLSTKILFIAKTLIDLKNHLIRLNSSLVYFSNIIIRTKITDAGTEGERSDFLMKGEMISAFCTSKK